MWLNGERRGVMVPSGLVGPLRWAVDLYGGAYLSRVGASVRIDGPKPPPAATAADLAEDERTQRELDAEDSDDD